MTTARTPPRIAIIGGGLAGLAAAVRLADNGAGVELFESRRQLGGRAGSFFDVESGEWIDHCQHVALGCCTEYLELCRTTGVLAQFRCDDTLNYLERDGRHTSFRGARWLPAPLHLGPALWGLKFLPWRDRARIARTMGRLKRASIHDEPDGSTIEAWLRQQGQTQVALDRFWSVILVSALSETLDRISVPAARQVFVEGFMAGRDAYHIWRPTIPLQQLYQRMHDWLIARGVRIRTETPVVQLETQAGRLSAITLKSGETESFDQFIIAVPWRRVGELLDDMTRNALPELANAERLESAPIAAVHLWFDRAITDLPHAIFLDRLSQWIFAKPDANPNGGVHYYQVVISAAQGLIHRSRESVLEEVLADIRGVFPAARDANLLRSKVLTEAHAVFSPLPGSTRHRPPVHTALPNLFLAGDWTATGWPSTMEGAVRSGNQAADAVLTVVKLLQ